MDLGAGRRGRAGHGDHCERRGGQYIASGWEPGTNGSLLVEALVSANGVASNKVISVVLGSLNLSTGVKAWTKKQWE